MREPVISIQNLLIESSIGQKTILNKVNLEVAKGEIVGLIGESGSGKSITARVLLGLLPSGMNVRGQIFFQNENLLTMSAKEHRKLLGKEIGVIFQDYRGSFTPFIKIGKQMAETIRTHHVVSKKEAKNISLQVLEEMGLDSKRVYSSYPFQLSGGQVQRAAIAIALALKPSLLICDEVTTALDVMSGEKVLDYIDHIRKETGCAVLMITHDLMQAYKRTDHIYVMHQGKIVEEGDPEQIRCYHQHPYTKKLCSCLLSLPGENNLVVNERVNSI
ncbi:peptide/nickel transport system ATP-binding protein [Evansella vedderi]|uniref:Peptide/nickel transport system ATP-binding protein n=1 Tax=Evansella vedderi TaxID=38282 RepID=A0ABT9ZNE4_9BACI|nr:ABC transporter ATP-binding protein [Evansella vedderi]MDQ0252753.1 peptide/nickel transport system ATP-binding protein [Evansella vedderi]